MSIQFGKEPLLSMAQVAAMLPPTGRGKRHPTTVWRWTKTGSVGVVLDSIKVGSATYTTASALQRFSAALARKGEPVLLRSKGQQAKAERAADRVLDRLKVGRRKPAVT